MKKASGSYYTPDALADFLIDKALSHHQGQVKGIPAIEPSCGDGALLRALARSKKCESFRIDAIEQNHSAIERARNLQANSSTITFHNCDFLNFTTKNRYKLCIGNPPYIKRKLIKAKQRELCSQIHTDANLANKSVNNIWTAFLIKSANLLTEDGVLAFILPAELLQVKFAQEIQGFLKQKFSRIEIYTFKEIVFQDLGQDIIALVAFKKAINPGVYFGQVEQLSGAGKALLTLTRSKAVESSDIKWAGHVLNDEDAELLLRVASMVKPISNYCSSCAGIVTAANNFFIVSKDIREEYNLVEFCKPIVQRGQFVNGSITFDDIAFGKLKADGKPCFLLDVNGKKLREMSRGVIKYLRKGRAQKIHERFKCTKRDRWYDVPSVWGSHAFFFKRSHLYPKLLLNETQVLVTDAAYRVSVPEPYSVFSLVFSFYNSMTLAMAEIGGRFYGGGVLELTPNEFKILPLPYTDIAAKQFEDFKSTFHSADGIRKVLEANDRILLKDALNLSDDEIGRLQRIRRQLVQRRLRSGRELVI